MRSHLTLLRACLLLLIALGSAARQSQAQDEKPATLTMAPGDFVVLETDRSGAFFVAAPLMEQYNALQRELDMLRADMAALRLDRTESRRRLIQIQRSLREVRQRMDAAKVYIAGTTVHKQTQTVTITAAPDDLILVEADTVEFRGWDKPEVQCVVEKIVLEKGDTSVDDELAAIVPELLRVSSKQVFGFYHDIAEKPEWKADWERFLFKEYLGHELIHITLKGMTAQEGNRFVSLEAKNEQGAGVHWGEWRRHARLVVYLPRCRSVGLMGGLQGFKSVGVRAGLLLQGQGDRDYEAVNAVRDHEGAIRAENLPLHDVANILGNVDVALLQFPGNYAETHDNDGVTVHAAPTPPMAFQKIQGDLRVVLTRGDLTVADVAGVIDISNDFGNTTCRVTSTLAARAHRVVTQSGEIELSVTPHSLDSVVVNLLTECGSIRVTPSARKDLGTEGVSFGGYFGAGPSRGWHGLAHKPAGGDKQAVGRDTLSLGERIENALRDEERPPGLDVITRGGTIVVQ